MANEIQCSISATITQSGQSVSGSGSFQANLSALNFLGQEVTIGSSSAAALPLGGLAAPTVVYIKNLDTTNYIQVDAVAALTSFPQTIHAGQSILLLPNTGTIYAKANGAPVQAWIVTG
jgi:hypothetical protein